MYASMVGVYMVPICIFELVPAENGGEIRVNIAILFLSTSVFTRCLLKEKHGYYGNTISEEISLENK